MGGGVSTSQGAFKDDTSTTIAPLSTSSIRDLSFFVEGGGGLIDVELTDDCVGEGGSLNLDACNSLISSANHPRSTTALLRIVAESLEISYIPEDLGLPSNIIGLDVTSNALSSFSLASQSSTKLEQLILSLNPDLFSSSSFVLSGVSQTLSFLDLSFVCVNKSVLFVSLNPLQNLRHLCLDGCELESLAISNPTTEGQAEEEDSFFLPPTVTSSLIELQLVDNGLTSIDELSDISKLVNLEVLNLSENDCQLDSNYRTRMLALIPSLKKFDSHFTSVGEIVKLDKVEGLRDAVEEGAILNAAEKEFDAAMKGRIDNTVVG
jgi:hypothetical protein